MKKQIFIFSLILVTFQCPGQTIVINEVCYSNKNILYDRDNDTPDWFELYNPGSSTINLADFKVIDDTSKSNWWKFPGYELKPGSYVVIFASDKDMRHNDEIHTSFKLGNMRESLFLINDQDEIIDEIDPQCVPTNCTLARFPDGSDNLIVMKPSPGTTNDNSEAITINFVKDNLTISAPAGLYDAPLTISLKNNNPGNVIMFTLNGKCRMKKLLFMRSDNLWRILTPAENRFADKPEEGFERGIRSSKPKSSGR
jgi:hypothetical protein